MITPATISMPHRHCVRYEAPKLTVELEVEPAESALIFYPSEPTVIEGSLTDETALAAEVAQWLRTKFARVEIDTSPKSSFQ